VDRLASDDHDYVSNKLERTVPLGLDVEAFTMESFETVEERSTESNEREHVTVYYREYPDHFSRGNVSSSEIFDDPELQNRTDLRVTLDEPADYRLLNEVFTGAPTEDPTPAEALRYIDEAGLAGINSSVKQKSMHDAAN
jgi:spore coat polysaccharide biosynthesis protein SpsF